MIVRFAGFGGQGVVMSSVIIGQAAAYDGKQAVQNQAYGSESRGGECIGDVIISDEEIYELEPESQDVLVAMTQPAYEKFVRRLRSNGTLIYDQDLVVPDSSIEPAGIGKYGLRATDIAFKQLGRKIVANMIMLGYMNALLRLVSEPALIKAVKRSVPPGTQDLNLSALREGSQLALAQRGVADRAEAADAAQ
jgi:2-oxoglutarate ferredoxin oxidoreductase subunit gamma